MRSRPRLPLRRRLRLGLEIVAAYVRVRRTLRGTDVEHAVAAVRAGVGPRAPGTVSEREWQLSRRLADIVGYNLGRLPGDTRCLTRSLVLVALLARRGIGCRLVIGVRVAPAFGAHAWPELAGEPLLAPIDASGRRLLEL